jgi:hypothetical protein
MTWLSLCAGEHNALFGQRFEAREEVNSRRAHPSFYAVEMPHRIHAVLFRRPSPLNRERFLPNGISRFEPLNPKRRQAGRAPAFARGFMEREFR